MFWLIVYFEKVPSAHFGTVLFAFLPFLITLKSIQYMFLCHEEGTHFFASRHLILLYKTSNLMKKWQQWVFNVMYYSTIYIVFKEIVLLFFAFCVVHISAWMVLQSKQSCFNFFLHTHTLTCCSETVSFIYAILTACPSK